MDASDHDKNLSSDTVKTAVQYMEYMYKNPFKKHKMSGEPQLFSDYVFGNVWLVYLNCRL